MRNIASVLYHIFSVSFANNNNHYRNDNTNSMNNKMTTTTTTSVDVRGTGVVCRVEVARIEWIELRPWQRTSQTKSTGTAFVIDGERLLTNAHVVKSAIDIRIRPHGSTRRFPAEVVCYAPDVDLALLKISGESEKADFFGHDRSSEDGMEENDVNVGGSDSVATTANKRRRETKSLEFAEQLPALQETVHVVGFPTGGRTICVTEGVVSRIDLYHRIVAIQVDSAINPGNSGGPAFNSRGEVTGVAFRKRTSGKNGKQIDNIGYLIPAVVVKAFLDRVDVESGTYRLSGTIPYSWHSLENKSLRAAHGVPHSVHGVLITSVAEEEEVEGCEDKNGGAGFGTTDLRKGDILTKIDDSDVADDGQVVLRGNELIQHAYLMRIKMKNEPVRFTVYRDGAFVECRPHYLKDIRPIVPRWDDVDHMPNYVLLGSLVLLPYFLGMKNYDRCGSFLKADCLHYHRRWPRELRGGIDDGTEGLVFLSEIFAHELSFSYSRPWRRVTSYNGIRIKSLKHLQDLWEEDSRLCRCLDDDNNSNDKNDNRKDNQSNNPSDDDKGDKNNGKTKKGEEDLTTEKKFGRLELENDDDIVFEVEAAAKTQKEVMATHAISKAFNILPPNPKYVV